MRRFLIVAVCACVALGFTAATGAALSAAAGHDAAPAATPHATKKLGHVFVINLENENYSTSWGPASKAKYLNATLRKKGVLLTKYYGVAHVSLGNYIAQISGQSPTKSTQLDCFKYTDFVSHGTGAYGQALGDGCVYPKTVKTIADQLTSAHKTWKAYMEDIGNAATGPKTCRHPKIGTADPTLHPTKTDMYATRHNPFMYFHSITGSATSATKVIGLGPLAIDLKSLAKTANLSYISPNVCNDGHDAPCVDGRPGGLVSADKFLQTWVPRILASPAYKADGMLVITFDEAGLGNDGDSTACCKTPKSPNVAKPGLNGPGGGKIGALVLSVNTTANTTSNVPYNHYALLCSMENVWGLKHLGFAGAPGLACFGKDVYNRP